MRGSVVRNEIKRSGIGLDYVVKDLVFIWKVVGSYWRGLIVGIFFGEEGRVEMIRFVIKKVVLVFFSKKDLKERERGRKNC